MNKENGIRAVRIPFLSYLQGKIVLIVFLEIRCLGFDRDPFAGGIAESSALMIDRHQAFFRAENSFFVQRRTVDTVLAGSGDTLTEEHGINRLSTLFLDYTPESAGMLLLIFPFFCKSRTSKPLITGAATIHEAITVSG